MLQEREWLKILKNSKAAGKNAVKDNKQWGEIVEEFVWKKCNMVFMNGVVPEKQRTVASAPLFKDKGESLRTIKVLVYYVYLEKYLRR